MHGSLNSIMNLYTNRITPSGKLVVRVHSEEPSINPHVHILTKGIMPQVKTKSRILAGFLL